MNSNTLNILADAVSDAGSWYWWLIKDDMVQIEFCDIMLYDNTKAENEPHTTDGIAVRFYGHAFALFLDNLDEEGWHEQLQEDDTLLYQVETYAMAFDDVKEAEALLKDYKNKIPVKDYDGPETIENAKHLLYARCEDVGLIVGGDEIRVVGQKGYYTEEEIETASKQWWEYWKAYWKARKTKDALPEDYVCEITIPVKKD